MSKSWSVTDPKVPKRKRKFKNKNIEIPNIEISKKEIEISRTNIKRFFGWGGAKTQNNRKHNRTNETPWKTMDAWRKIWHYGWRNKLGNTLPDFSPHVGSDVFRFFSWYIAGFVCFFLVQKFHVLLKVSLWSKNKLWKFIQCWSFDLGIFILDSQNGLE